MSRTNRSNKLFEQTRIATLGLQDLLAFGQLQPDGTYKVRNVTNSNFLNAIVISEQITHAELLALATASELVAGKNYTITDAVSGTLSLYIFAVSTSKLAEYGYDTTTGQVYSYDLATDTATNADNTGYINFTPQTAPAYQRGRVWYDSTTETLSVYDDISGTSVQLGQEEILRARNSTGSTILNGAVVYVSGAQGQNPRVSLALANAASTSRVIGVATHNISNNSVGKITTFGIVGDLNTSAYNEGDVLYLSASVAGGLTTTRPSAPNQAVMVGTVIHAAVNDGKILVHTDNYGVGFGTANQVRGMNAAGTAEEYKTIQGTASEVEVLHTANTVTIGLPNAVTISGAMTAGSFVKSGGVSAQFLKADGTVDANAYFYTNAQVTGQALTGLSVSGSAVVSTDSILTGIGKLQNQINAVLGSVNFQGVWNASTNTPTLTSSVGTKGYYYIVTVAGSTNLDGITDWKLGDWAIYDGTAWQKVDNTDAVVSVNGYTGIVTLAKADIGLGNVENTALSTWAGSTNITTLGTISSGVWNGTAIGDTYISSASTWNAKIGGSGTTGKLAKFTSSGAVGDSIVSETADGITIDMSTNYYGNFAIKSNSSTSYFGINVFANANNKFVALNHTGTYGIVETESVGVGSSGILIRTGGANRIEFASNGQIITASATNTGEAHIFGGSARVNGNLNIYSSSITLASFISSSTSAFVALGDSSGNITYIGSDDGTLLIQTPSGGYSTKLSLSNTELITFGATDTGEAHIFGGSARVNGNLVTNAGYVQIRNSSNPSLYINNENIQWQQYVNSSNNLVFSDAISNVLTLQYNTGNVGIGTTSPLMKLDIVGTSGLPATSGTTPVGSLRLHASNNAVLDFGVDHGTAKGWIQSTDVGDLSAYYGLMLNPRGGNVLIGTTTDDGVNKLQVAGSLIVKQNTSNLDGEIFLGQNTLYRGRIFYDGSINGQFIFDNRYDTTSATGGFLFRTRTSGTPVNALQIAGDGAATFSKSTGYGTIASFLDAANSGIKLVANASVGYNEIISDGNQPFLITVNSAERFRIAGNGAATFTSSVQATTLKLTSLPTSSAGLSAGDIWNDGGTLKIV